MFLRKFKENRDAPAMRQPYTSFDQYHTSVNSCKKNSTEERIRYIVLFMHFVFRSVSYNRKWSRS